jgi:hypothetical protein
MQAPPVQSTPAYGLIIIVVLLVVAAVVVPLITSKLRKKREREARGFPVTPNDPEG